MAVRDKTRTAVKQNIPGHPGPQDTSKFRSHNSSLFHIRRWDHPQEFAGFGAQIVCGLWQQWESLSDKFTAFFV